MKIGIGYDVHRLVPGRQLILGGALIPFEKGLLGHSDADVLVHAVCDALLGSVGLGDIGQHFPDDDPRWEGADSKELIRHVAGLLDGRGWMTGNVDVTVIAERPKLTPWIESMRASIAGLLGCPVDAVWVKATTHEGLGALGAGEGIAAMAVAMLFPQAEGQE